MTEDQLKKGEELAKKIKVAKEKIFYLENNRFSSLYVSNNYHVDTSEELGDILKKITIAHFKSDLHRLQKEFKNL